MPLWEIITITCACGFGGGIIGGIIVTVITCVQRKRRKEPGENRQSKDAAPEKKEKTSGTKVKEWQNPQVVMLEKERSARMQNLIDRLYNGENKKTKRSKKE